jgi:PAS domain S-box-containing protein
MKVKSTRIFDTLPDSIRIIGSDRKIVWVNRRFEQLFSGQKKDFIGKACSDYFCAEQLFGDGECSIESFERGETVSPREITLKDKNGTVQSFLVTYTPYQNETGDVIGVVEYLREITSLTITRTALEEQLLRSKVILGKTVNSLVSAIESRDPYTAGHQRKVSQLVRRMAQKFKPNDRRWIEGIRVAAQLHDIGKICVPAEILSHPGNLGKEQFELIKLHSETGFRILGNVEFAFGFPVSEVILQHHERLDGSGYPGGVTANRIMLEARILAVADVVEAMINHRPYRAGLGIDSALQEIVSNAGKKYDKEVAEVCRSLFVDEGFDFQETV